MPSDFVNDLRVTAAAVRAIRGPTALDVIPTTVTIEVRSYPSGYRSVSEPPVVVSSLKLAPYPVRHVSTREVADSGGRFTADDVKVRCIDLPWTDDVFGTSGGYSIAQLDPAHTIAQNSTTHQGVDVVYVLATENTSDTGIAGEYSLIECKKDRQFHAELVLRRRKTTP